MTFGIIFKITLLFICLLNVDKTLAVTKVDIEKPIKLGIKIGT